MANKVYTLANLKLTSADSESRTLAFLDISSTDGDYASYLQYSIVVASGITNLSLPIVSGLTIKYLAINSDNSLTFKVTSSEGTDQSFVGKAFILSSAAITAVKVNGNASSSSTVKVLLAGD